MKKKNKFDGRYEEMLEEKKKEKLAELAKELYYIEKYEIDTKTHKAGDIKFKKLRPHILAEWIKTKYDIITLKDTEKIMYFNDGIYHNNGEALIKETAKREINNISRNEVKEVIEHIKWSSYIDREELNKYSHLIPLKNGIYTLNEKKLIPSDPKYKITTRLPIIYNPKATCPNIKKFITEIVGEDQTKLIQEMFGYTLLRDYKYNKAFMLFGSGKNGKTTLLNLLISFLGLENTCSASLQDLCYNRFAKVKLFGKLANIHDDLPNTPLTHTGNFKILTGKGLIWADVKFSDGFEFINTAKLIFSCNELPKTDDTTYAFFRRWEVIKFERTFEGNNCDPNILQKLTTEEELSGLFNWAIEGLERLEKQGGFSSSNTANKIKEEWITQTDPLRAFVQLYIQYSPESFITKEEFVKYLNLFCHEHNAPELTAQNIGQNLPSILPKLERERITYNGKQVRVWKGISFNEKFRETFKTVIQPFLTSRYRDIENSIVYNKDKLDKLGYLSNKPIKKHIKAPINELKRVLGEEFAKDQFIDLFSDEQNFTKGYSEDLFNIYLNKGIIYEFKPKRYKWVE